MPLLFHCAHFDAFEPIDDDEVRALKEINNGFLYYIQFNHAMFQSVIWMERMIMIISNCELQIGPPNIPYKKCLLQVIGSIPNTANDTEYTADELECFAELPSGWKLSELKAMSGYRSAKLPEINYDMFRLCWYLGAPHPSEAESMLFIHPSQDRPLTGLEWDAIEAASGDGPLLAWLGSLGSQPLPSNAAGTPVLERTEGIERVREVVIDLRPFGQFPALQIYPYPEPRKPARLFNVNSDGTLKVAWHLISNRKQGTLTYEPISSEASADQGETSEN